MTREPYSDPGQWHDLAQLVVEERLTEATRTIDCGRTNRDLRVRYYPIENLLVIEESAESHHWAFHTIAEYEGRDLETIVRGDRERFLDALSTYDRGEKTFHRIRSDIKFADHERQATLVKCSSCGYQEVSAGEIEWPDCCEDSSLSGSPLIDRNEAVDLVSAPFEDRIESLDDGPAREELIALYETLFPPFEEEAVNGDPILPSDCERGGR